MSHQAAYLRAPAEAVDLARSAARAAAEAGVAAIQAEAAVLEAQGHAVGGDEAACAAALDRAERAFDRADRPVSRSGSATSTRRTCRLSSGTASPPLAAATSPSVRRALAGDGRPSVRARTAVQPGAAGGRPCADRGAGAGQRGRYQAVDAAEGLRSGRARDYLADLADRLAPHAGLPAVREFIERARPVLRARLKSAGRPWQQHREQAGDRSGADDLAGVDESLHIGRVGSSRVFRPR